MSEEKKKMTQEEAKKRLKKIDDTINKFAEKISKEVDKVKAILPENCNLEQLIQQGIGEDLELLFIYDFAREIKIAEIAAETGKSLEIITKECEHEIKVYCGLFIYNVVKELKKEEYDGLSFSQLVCEWAEVDGFADIKIKPGSRLAKLVSIVKAKIAADATEKEPQELENIKGIKPQNFKLPLTKLHDNIFDSLFNERGQIPGQISFLDPSTFDTENENNNLIALNVGGKNDKERADRLILYGIDQEDLEGLNISREIDSFDQRVYDAICTLYDCGNRVITLTQIYNTMGGSKPSKKILETVNNSVVKLWSTKVFVDETKDYEQYLPKDGRIKHRGRILNLSFKEAYMHNKHVESAIVLLEEPYILQFSKRRKQVEAIPRNVIENPTKRMTNKNLAIENYLLTRISRMKGAKRSGSNSTSNKIKFDKIVEKAHEKDKPQRVVKTAREYLEHYKSEDIKWIKDFKEKDGYFEIEL